MRALVVGAGIGGLAAALALRRRGWDVCVVEQAATPRELGFALALAPHALEALGELGLRDAVVSRGIEVKAFEVRHADGRVAKRFDLRGDAVQSVVVLRPALHGTLLDAVGADALVLGARVTTVEDSGVGSRSSVLPQSTENQDPTPVSSAEDGAGVQLADGRRIDADVVVGADGAGSVIRQALHPGEPPPRASGYRALRGVSYDVGDRLGRADAAVYLGDGVEIGFARASPSAVYWYISLVEELATEDVTATLDRCLRGIDANAVTIARAARADDIRPDRLLNRDPIDRWGRGRITLLGDAAHPVLPHTAQGAALALEDAVALGLALARRDGIDAALRRYEEVRAARTRSVVRSGPRIAAMTTTRSRGRLALRNTLLRLMPARALSIALTLHVRDPHRALRG